MRVVSRVPLMPCSGLKIALSSTSGMCASRSMPRRPCESTPVWFVTRPTRHGREAQLGGRTGMSLAVAEANTAPRPASTSSPVFTCPLRECRSRVPLSVSL